MVWCGVMCFSSFPSVLYRLCREPRGLCTYNSRYPEPEYNHGKYISQTAPPTHLYPTSTPSTNALPFISCTNLSLSSQLRFPNSFTPTFHKSCTEPREPPSLTHLTPSAPSPPYLCFDPFLNALPHINPITRSLSSRLGFSNSLPSTLNPRPTHSSYSSIPTS